MLDTNIIKIALRSSKVIKTLPVHKWDTGMQLEFEGIDIPLNTTCHFETGEGTTVNQLVDSTTKRVDIPNDLIGQYCWFEELRAHLYIPTSSYAMTVYDIIIPVIEREQPADHVSPDNTQTIEEWITEQVGLIDADRQAVENMSATASVDNNTGTPAVTVTKTTVSDHVNLDFAFVNIKGARGDTGDQIGDITASVDANTGTPSVTVTQTGGSGSPIDIDFAFSNLKGATGATGATGAQGNAGMGISTVTATIDEDGGTPECFVLESVPYPQPDPTKPIKNLQFNFVNIKGDAGDSIGTVTASVDGNTGTPAVTVTQTGGSGSPIDIDLAFSNLKGTGLPANPGTDGDYILACQRKSGTSTMSWSGHLNAIDDLLFVSKTLTFEYGSIANDGTDGNNTRWLRTPGYLQFKGDKVRLNIKTIADCTLNVRVFRYDSTKTYVSRNHWSNQTIDIDVRSDYYYRFMIFSSNPGTYQLDIDDVNDYYGLKEYVSMSDITPPDKTLSIDGRSADALAVRHLFEGDDSMLYNVITLKTDGTGDFTSLRSAVESISDASKSNPYMIEIYPGTYDVMDDFTSAEILAYADPSVKIGGIIIGDGINLRGIGNAKDIVLNGYLPTTYDKDDIRNKVATITIGGNVSIENMTIVAENIRYCVHDSYSQSVGKYKRVMKDVVLIAHTLTSGNPERTYGCGMMSPGQDSYFENVDFGSDLVIHDNAVVSEPTVTVMKNCRGDQFNFNTKANYSVNHTLYMDGCSFASLRLPETDTLNAQNTLVYANGNPDIMVDALPGRVIMTPSVTKVKKSNLSVGTVVKLNNYTATATTDYDIAYGVIINNDSDYTYVQRCGYVKASYLGLTLSEGAYVTTDANGELTTTGATESNAVGIAVSYRSNSYIRLRNFCNEFSVLPSVTSADEGKFPVVNSSGQWAKSNAFEEEVFTFTLSDNTTVTKTFLVKV